MNYFRPLPALVCAVMMSGALGGCQAVVMGVATPMITKQKHVNLVNSSYAAAEILAQQTGRRFSKESPLIVSDLQEIVDTTKDNVVTNPKVGQVIGEQIRTRFVQLGYNVADVPTYHGGNIMGEVSGTYSIVNSVISISLKLTDKKTGRILGTNDYALPVTYEIRQYMTRSHNPLSELPEMPYLPPLF